MQAHPLIPPLIAPGCWPQATDEDKRNGLLQLRQQRYIQAGMESCVSKGIIAYGVGFGFGMLLSLFSFGMAYDNPFGRPVDGKEVHWKQVLKGGLRSAVSQGKSFGAIGGAYSVCECIVESYRGKHDTSSAVGGGILAGALLARNNGSKAMLLGGLGFGGFSWAIEHFWIQRPPADDDSGFFVC